MKGSDFLSSKLFALDIGTRSVVGIIIEEQNNHFHVIDILVKEHKERAMVDGQIHNVLYVAQLIKDIKNELEEKHGPLKKVSVAAAGRALKTSQASITIDIKNRPIFTEEDIGRLELLAVQQAQSQLLSLKDDEQQNNHYYCVGYSVLYYKLDGEEIGSLLDQQGNEAVIEVIATFLPRVVVESLLAALKRADLEMEAMTLEPIAAINVLIPPSMRRLNVALVDIGAGTSDIAITDKGTVVAYGMVPTAGDEITEALSDQYLLDFPIAEKVKRQLTTADEIIIQDILGFDQTYPKEEVVQAIQPSIQNLAKSIGDEILKLNNQVSPKAVMLVGGGSLTPHLPAEVCKILNLPANRVAVRGLDAIQNLTKDPTIPTTPELVTPIGIAIAAKRAPIQYMSVTVNEQVVRLFEMKEMTVSDAFLAANIRAKQLYGAPGQGIAITVNGQNIFVPGGHGEPATILVNGKTASTKTMIKNGDSISLIAGKNGFNAKATVRDMIDPALIKVITFQGKRYTLEPRVTVNGKQCSFDLELQERDHLELTTIEVLEEFLKDIQAFDSIQRLKPFYIHVNGKPTVLPDYTSKLLINEKPGKLNFPLRNEDCISIEDAPLPTIENIAQQLNINLEEKIVVKFQQETIELSKICREIHVNGQAVLPTAIISNGASLSIIEKDTQPWIFQDIFRYSNWQLPTDFKGHFSILRNGVPSSFDEVIYGGDQLEIILSTTQIIG